MDEKAVKARRLLYLSEYKKRRLALVNAAKESCTAYLALLQQPVVGSGPLGHFTFFDEIAIDFAMRLENYLSEEQLSRAPVTVNAAALQKFAQLVKSSGLVSLHAARTPAEEAMTEFVALRQRLQYAANEEDVRLLISAVQQKERIKYGSLREVAALDADASLLEIVSAVRKAADLRACTQYAQTQHSTCICTQAAAPKRGRPPKLTASAGGFDVAMNWVDGGYSVESMAARAAFDTRRINVSQRETQSDVLVGSALLFTGLPSLMELRQFKPRNRPLQISHASTARLHAIQLNQYHCDEAARRVHAWFPQWDEGSKRGVTAVLVGANGLLNDIVADLLSHDDFYSDALGFEVLSSKTGKAVAEALIVIFERRGITEYYFVGTDAVSSNIGHVSGAIAYLRRHQKEPCIFALRCNGHIDMRAWKHGLEATGTEASRSPIKRKADEATLCGELLAVEDLYYCEKKWPALGDAMQERLPNGETNLKSSGCPDSRWTFWEELLANKIGCTRILLRLKRLWHAAVLKSYEVRGVEFDGSTVPEEEPLLGERVPLRIAMGVIAEDDWHRQAFDMSLAYGDQKDAIDFYQFLDLYTGPWILDHLDVAITKLGGDGVRDAMMEGGELHEEGVKWAPPEDCPVSALTAESLPGLLLDLGSQYMRVRWVAWEVIGDAYVMPYLHRKEMRYPGIAFDAHEIIGTQRDIGVLFGDPNDKWTISKVEEYSERFAVALDAAMRYAQLVEMEEFMYEFIDQFMLAHSEYHLEQTEEWWSNPVFRLAGLGSTCADHGSEYHGTALAAWLVEQGRAELRKMIAEVLHISAAEVKKAIEKPSYDGPLVIFADDALWAQLILFTKQKLTLAECKGVDELRAVIHRHYKPLYLTNVWMEELVKEFKNLTPQALTVC